MASREENKAVVRRLIDEGWNQGNVAVIDESLAPDFQQHVFHPPQYPPGVQGMHAFLTGMRESFPDFTYSIDHLLSYDDKVAAHLMFRGTNTGSIFGLEPTNRPAAREEIHIFHLRDGKIAELWGQMDNMGVMQQLGFAPPAGAGGHMTTPLPDLSSVGSVIGYALSFQAPRALQVASALDLFTILADAPLTMEEVADRTGTSHRGMDILLTVMTAIGLLRREDGRFSLTNAARGFLVRGSRFYLGSMMNTASDVYEFYADLEKGVRTGKGVALPPYDSPDPGVIRNYVYTSAEMGQQLAMQLVGLANLSYPRKLLDLGAGSGVYAFEYCLHYPQMQAVLLDWPQMLEITKELIKQRGYEDRVSTIGGDVLQVDYGSGYDVVLMCSFLHGFSEAETRTILRKTYESMASGGHVIVHDQVLNEERNAPLSVALHGLIILLNRDEGEPHAIGDLCRWMEEAGFTNLRDIPLPPSPSVSKLIIARKP